MNKKRYTVHRAMTGDRDYERGDTREMTEADAAPLVAAGALSEVGVAPIVRAPMVTHTAVITDGQNLGPSLANKDVSDSRIEGRRSPAKKGG